MFLTCVLFHHPVRGLALLPRSDMWVHLGRQAARWAKRNRRVPPPPRSSRRAGRHRSSTRGSCRRCRGGQWPCIHGTILRSVRTQFLFLDLPDALIKINKHMLIAFFWCTRLGAPVVFNVVSVLSFWLGSWTSSSIQIFDVLLSQSKLGSWILGNWTWEWVRACTKLNCTLYLGKCMHLSLNHNLGASLHSVLGIRQQLVFTFSGISMKSTEFQ